MVSVSQNAVLAAEPKPYATGYASEPPEVLNSKWDTDMIPSLYFQNASPVADWIWETARAEDPAGLSGLLYDADASSNGRVVVFEKTFFIPGTPQDATLHITPDNCYEVWINGTHVARSGTALVDGWETTNLDKTAVDTNGWQTVGEYLALNSYLNANDNNTIKIMAGNESFFDSDNSPQPPYVAGQYQYNPGALIFKLDVEYEESNPPPPVPEFPAGLLFGLGLLGVGGFVLVRRHRLAAAK